MRCYTKDTYGIYGKTWASAINCCKISTTSSSMGVRKAQRRVVGCIILFSCPCVVLYLNSVFLLFRWSVELSDWIWIVRATATAFLSHQIGPFSGPESCQVLTCVARQKHGRSCNATLTETNIVIMYYRYSYNI